MPQTGHMQWRTFATGAVVSAATVGVRQPSVQADSSPDGDGYEVCLGHIGHHGRLASATDAVTVTAGHGGGLLWSYY
jgi:hypothetical protein